MTTAAAVGHCQVEDAFEAGRTCARIALDGLPEHRADLAIVFATTGYDQNELLRGIRGEVGDARLVGCSGEGVIVTGLSLECELAASVMAVQSDKISFETHLLGDYSADSAACGAELARRIVSEGVDDLIGVLVFPDGLMGNCGEFLTALNGRLSAPVAVVGGTSADAMVFEQTFQYAGETVASDSVSALVMRGGGEIEIAISHGCSPIGLDRQVTRAEGGWVYEIDGRPAWSVFKEYLDDDPEDLDAEGVVQLCIGAPLAGDAAEEYAPYVIRTPLGLDKETGALFFPGGGLPGGGSIRLTRRDPDRVKESARACATSILERQPDREPAFVMQFDCAGRGRVLFGNDAGDMIVRPLQEALGSELPWIGFHSYGEIGPVGSDALYHNYTVALCAVYDE